MNTQGRRHAPVNTTSSSNIVCLFVSPAPKNHLLEEAGMAADEFLAAVEADDEM